MQKRTSKILRLILAFIMGLGLINGPQIPQAYAAVQLNEKIVQVEAGLYHTLALTENGDVWAWGNNTAGQLGDGTTVSKTRPVKVQDLTGVIAIAGGEEHSLALKSDGTVWSWGANPDGQLGEGTTVGKTTPVQVTGLTDVKAIASGLDHNLALKTDKTLWAWGNGASYRLGNGSTATKTTPIKVSQLTNVKAIDCGYTYSLAVKEDGTVWGFGNNINYQIGSAQILGITRPVRSQIPAVTKEVSGGSTNSLAINEDGSVWSWGKDLFRNQDDSETSTHPSYAVQVQGLTNAKAIENGDTHSLVLNEDGSLYSWGGNEYGQLGNGTTTSGTVPVRIIGMSSIKDIAVGGNHSVAVQEDGSVWAWGLNIDGQLGDGTTANKSTPQLIIEALEEEEPDDPSPTETPEPTESPEPTNQPGQTGTVAARITGKVTPVVDSVVVTVNRKDVDLTEKYDMIVELRRMNNLQTTYMRSIAQPDGTDNIGTFTFSDVPSGEYALVLYRTGFLLRSMTVNVTGNTTTFSPVGEEVFSFIGGDNNYNGQIDDSDNIMWLDRAIDEAFRQDTSPYYPILDYNGDGLLDDVDHGTMTSNFGKTAWTDYPGALSQENLELLNPEQNDIFLTKSTPVNPEPDDPTPTETPAPVTENNPTIAAGKAHSLYLQEDGTVLAWGDNQYGQLGDGTTENRTKPAIVPGLTDVKAIAAGDTHSLALKEDGSVWFWGKHQYGYGDFGTMDQEIEPVQVMGLSDVKAIACGGMHSMALKADGTIMAWGDNDYGQLGDGTYDESSTPVQVQGLTDVKAITAGYPNSLAIKKDGSVYAWGATDDYNNIPSQIPGLSDVKAVESGDYHGLALKEDGSVWSWGSNYSGQLGNGTTTDSSTPIQVRSLQNVKAIAANGEHSMALMEDGTIMAWGWNVYGQLGDGTTINKTSPVQVQGLTGIKEISGGFTHNLAIKEDNSVWAWGFNGDGRLGDGKITFTSAPVKILPVEPTDIIVETVTGKVTPVVYDDLGRGKAFLEGYDVIVELRKMDDLGTTFMQTIAKPDGTTGIGTFTFNDVPAGEYELYLYRPGYLIRTMAATITGSTTTLKPPGDEEIFHLMAGDADADGNISDLDLGRIVANIGAGFDYLGEELFMRDFNANGIVDKTDEDMLRENMSKSYYHDYPGAISVGDPMLDSYFENGTGIRLYKQIAPIITGKVTPVAYDDLGRGKAFLEGYDVIVELRKMDDLGTTFMQTIAKPDGTTGIGTFTFNDVPAGEYRLHIYRPGYIMRLMNVTITGGTTTLKPPGDEEIFHLIAGDIDTDSSINNEDAQDFLLYYPNADIEDLGKDFYLYDLNSNGVIDEADRDALLGNDGKSVSAYPGTPGEIFDEDYMWELVTSGDFRLHKQTAPEVTGKVTPVVYDDLGLGKAFLEGYDVIVELRKKDSLDTTFMQTIAKPDGVTGIGSFGFNNVPAGEYLLMLYRPGYIMRILDVTIAGSTTKLTSPEEDGIFYLYPGDINSDSLVDDGDTMRVIDEMGSGIDELDDKLPSYDLNNNGVVDESDRQMTMDSMNNRKDFSNYPGAPYYLDDYLLSLADNLDFRLHKLIAPEVTGKVAPVIYDDLGRGPVFLSGYDVLVELRKMDDLENTYIQTIAKPDGTTGIGTFTFKNIPAGDYRLHIYRPGYILRVMDVTVTQSTTVFEAPENDGIFHLWAGEVAYDGLINEVDAQRMSMMNTAEQDHDDIELAACDFNGNGIVDQADVDEAYENMMKCFVDYPGTPDYMLDFVLDYRMDYLLELAYNSELRLINALATPENIRETGRSGNTVTLAWDAVPGATGYDVVYKNVVLVSTDTNEITLDNLVATFGYDVYVRAKDDTTVSDWGKMTARITALEAPDGLFCFAETPSTAQLSWNRVYGALLYEIRQNGTVLQSTSPNIIVNGYGTNSLHTFQVRAKVNNQWTPWSAVLEYVFLPFPDIPVKPFVAAPQTAYAQQFIADSENEQWFLDEIERLLNQQEKTINRATDSSYFDNIFALGFTNKGSIVKIPAAVGELKQLKHLYFAGNKITAITPEIYTLTNLETLDLSRNQLAGSIDPAIGNLQNLRVLSLWSNKLTGTIPAAMTTLTKLRNFDVSQNQLTGGIPSNIGNLKELLLFSASNNRLTGTIPGSITGCTRLTGLLLWNNQLTGTIPSNINALNYLEILDLSQNQLTGNLPPSIPSTLKKFAVRENELTGGIPAAYSNARALNTFDVKGNQLTGELPQTFGNLNDMVKFDVSDNQLTGNIPAAFRNFKNLEVFDVSNNLFEGTIPNIFYAMDFLRFAHFNGNQFTGKLPQSLFDRQTAGADVNLEGNNITGLSNAI